MWVKIDDLMPEHPKLVQAGALAFALDVAGVCYCARHLTDGFVPAGAVHGLLDLADINAYGASSDDLRKHLVGRLVDVGRWVAEADGSGWWIHGYLEYNPSGAEVKERRAYERDRKRDWRESRKLRPVSQLRPDDVPPESHGTPDDVPGESRGSPLFPYPYPFPKNLSSSEVSVDTQSEPDLKDDDETISESEMQTSPEAQKRAAAAAALLADDDVKGAEARGIQIQDRKAYKAQCRKERMAVDGRALAELSDAHPGWMPRRLADALVAADTETPAGQPRRANCPHCGRIAPGAHHCLVIDADFDPDANGNSP